MIQLAGPLTVQLVPIVDERNRPIALALALALMWLWWVMDSREIARVKGRQADSWTAITLLTGPLGWLVLKMLPSIKNPDS